MLRVQHHTARLAIAYKNFAAAQNVSHIGLGVSATQNAKALRSAGYIVEIWPINSFADLQALMKAEQHARTLAHHVPLSHLVISAPWILTANLATLASQNPDLEIAVVSHSNIGFLQADPRAIELLRQGSELEQGCPNFHVAANSQRFQTWWQSTYGTAMTLLPNMYPVGPARTRAMWQRGTLRLGCFCAIRPYKNVLTAAAAALEVGQRLRVTDLEFWISGGRHENGGQTIVAAIQQMYLNMPRAKVVEQSWQSWPQFLTTVGSMDLLLQPSYTEGFNMVTADGIAQGVASVVSDAIAWAPRNWQAATDAASDIANKAVALLHDPTAVQEGAAALEAHNSMAQLLWEKFLKLFP
jgi:glycosyltransferase involved in cell wall biosynthesis